MLGTSSAHSANPHLFNKLPYEPIDSFVPISRTNDFPFVLLVPGSSPYKSVDDLVQDARSRPGALSFGHGNSTGLVAGSHFMRGAGFEAVAVPYKSTPPALVDLVDGRVQFMFVDVASSQAFVSSGQLRILAV